MTGSTAFAIASAEGADFAAAWAGPASEPEPQATSVAVTTTGRTFMRFRMPAILPAQDAALLRALSFPTVLRAFSAYESSQRATGS